MFIYFLSFLMALIMANLVQEYSIETTWNNQSVNHDPVKIWLETELNYPDSLIINIKAPFFNSPPRPDKEPGDAFNLWDYEVAETFFLSESGHYLELEFGPFGHYLVLLLNGTRQILKMGLPIVYNATIEGNYWTGKAIIPESYFPYKVSKFNAYAIHGENETRQYEALYPVDSQQFKNPDFHRLQFFKQIDFKDFLPKNNDRNTESDVWTN